MVEEEEEDEKEPVAEVLVKGVMERVCISQATFYLFLPPFGAFMFHPRTDASSSSVTLRPCGRGSLGWTASKWAAMLYKQTVVVHWGQFTGRLVQRMALVAARGPKTGQKCYVTLAFSGIPEQKKIKSELVASPVPSRGPKRGRKCYKIRIGCLTLAFSEAQIKGEMLHHPCILGGPPKRGQSQSTEKKQQKNLIFFFHCVLDPAWGPADCPHWGLNP